MMMMMMKCKLVWTKCTADHMICMPTQPAACMGNRNTNATD